MLPSHRPPTTPGKMLLREFLRPMKMPVHVFAEKAGLPVGDVKEVIAERRVVTPWIAKGFAKALTMTAEFWLSLQADTDEWHRIHPHWKTKRQL